MSEEEARSGQANDLCRQAEEIARQKTARMPENLEALAPEEVRQLLHELRVHQIELDVQKEELHQAKEELRWAKEALQQAHDELGQRAAKRTEESRRAKKELQLRTNIIGRRQADAAIRVAVDKYRSLAASVDSMYLVDKDCRYLFMNEVNRLRFGLPLEEIIGRRYGEFHSEESAREFADKVREVCGTGKSSTKEHRSKRDGRYFLRTFTPIMGWDPDRETLEVVVVSKDITERRQIEQQLIGSLQQLQQTKDMLIQFEKHAAVGRLATGLAHEILNPTSIISSRLQFLEEEILSEQAKENLKICREQIQRIVKISQDLRQSSAEQPRPLVHGDLRRVIDVGLQMMERRINEAHVQVEYHPPPEAVHVRMEIDRMVKVIVNLILNACDAITGNQTKRVIVTVQYPEVSSKNFSIRLIVADNGHGIPSGYLDLIFEPFFTTKDPGKGTGLGLSVCKGIIQEHGGTIHAENNDMGGATFVVELPPCHP